MRQARQCGFSLVELLIVVAVILVLAAAAIPNLIKARIAANEASATATMKTINLAVGVYAATYDYGFPDHLHKLAPPRRGRPTTYTAAGLLDPQLAGAAGDHIFVKSGYVFTYSPDGSFGSIGEYTLEAQPVARGSSGIRSFYTDQDFVIRANATTSATVSDNPI